MRVESIAKVAEIEEAEKAKIALSSTQSYDISLPFITMDATGPKHIQMTLTRSKLEQLTENLLERRRTLLSALSGGVAGQPAGKPGGIRAVRL